MILSLRTIFDEIKVVPLTNSLENLSQGCKIGLITYAIPCNGYSFSLVFPHFLSFLLIFMNMQMRQFSNRTRSSINSPHDITRSITKCHDDSLGLKLVHVWFFGLFHIFIKIYEYASKIICIAYHKKKGLSKL